MKTRMLIIGLFILGCLVLSDNSFSGTNVISPKVRVKAPAFTLKSIDGSVKSLHEWNGRIILLHFWATWCAPCRYEMPALERLWKRVRDRDFAIIAIAADRGNPDKVQKYCKKLGISFPILLDPEGNVRNQYEVTALPISYLIGKDGKIIYKIIGTAQWDNSELMELLENLLDSHKNPSFLTP